MQAVRKPRWQQATALVSLSTCGAMTGFSLAHGTVADLTSPASLPVHLLAASKPAGPACSGDLALRAAIVKAANYYLRLAQRETPGQIEAQIWQGESGDGVDHGESCAAFASLTLETGSRATGQQSWVTGGGSYPWQLYDWADVRVDPNPDSLNIVSILQDAQTHHRWHPLGDSYTPQPGDWVLFDGHVEVVTKYSGGVLDTIGGDSMPNLSVNAHRYADPLGAQGVTGFVNNGELLSSVTTTPAGTKAAPPPVSAPAQVEPATVAVTAGQAAIPGLAAPAAGLGAGALAAPPTSPTAQPAAPRQPASLSSTQAALFGAASVPGSQPVSGSVTSYTSGRRPAVQPQRGDPGHADGAGLGGTAGVHQRGGTGSAGRAARIWRPGRGDDRAGHRRVGLGPEPAGAAGQEPVRHQGHRTRGHGADADAGVPGGRVGDRERAVPGVRQRGREHHRPCPAAGHVVQLQTGHGQQAVAGHVRQRPDRRLRHRPRLRLDADRADAVVQPVPLRRQDGERTRHFGPGGQRYDAAHDGSRAGRA